MGKNQSVYLPLMTAILPLLLEKHWSVCFLSCSVPTVPVKNLNGSSPVHPALAGKEIACTPHPGPCLGKKYFGKCDILALSALGITGILMSAAALPVCLTRPPKLVLHPPPVSKSDIKPVPGLGHCCRKTTKKQARKGACSIQDQPEQINEITNTSVRFFYLCSHPILLSVCR